MARPLQFLQLTTFYPPYHFGGDGIYVQRLSQALAEQGHQVDVVHCEDSYLLAGIEPDGVPEEIPGVHRHPLRSSFGPLSPLLSHQTGRPFLKQGVLRKLLRAKRYDVVHFHNVSLFGPTVLELDAPGAVKLYTTHEYWLVCPTHLLRKFGKEMCESRECLRCVVKAKRPPQLWRYTGLLERAVQSVDQFLAPSKFAARAHGQRGFGAPFMELPNFCNRVDGDWMEPGPPPHPRPYFLYAGRLESVKGPQDLIGPWSEAPDSDLVIAGAGSMERELRAMAAASPRIHFAGRLSEEQLGKFYAHAQALIVPSESFEIFALVLAEAFARKLPVIARNVGGLAEVAAESGGGLLYSTEDELLEHVWRLHANPALRTELGERGYGTFLAKWTREAHLSRYFEILRMVAERKFGRVPWEAD
jgi:glycosyltransferase involved in cell wall biosynthesis